MNILSLHIIAGFFDVFQWVLEILYLEAGLALFDLQRPLLRYGMFIARIVPDTDRPEKARSPANTGSKH
jgi:hypothetical protein